MGTASKSSKNSIADRLHALLAKIDRPGTFCTSGAAPAIMPGLDVNGLGAIGLPLTGVQAKELKKRCDQAAYGKGEQTLVDTDVRRVWRLGPNRFTLSNPAWPDVLKEIVASVERDLGLERQKLEPHLYELLLYEKGSFFLPHRDGEKLDRMVATLTVVLPSAYEGGELIVRHEGQECVIDFAVEGSAFQTRYAAFYADCEHEVKPLRSGYRLCLVYNLTLSKPKATKAKTKAKTAKPIGAPRHGPHVDAIAAELRRWSADADGPEKLAFTLEHQYTQEGLAWDTLKGIDAARAKVLAEAASQTGCHANLALLTFYQSGSAEVDYDFTSYRHRRRGRYSYYGEDEAEDGEHEMGEIYETTLSADHWRSPSGKRPPLGEVPVDADEVVPKESLTEVEPQEDFEGYTGNAGMTLERWYRHGVIVVWPDNRHFDVLCAGGSRQAVPGLARMVSSWRKAPAARADAEKRRCIGLAERILTNWPEVQFDERRRSMTPEGDDLAGPLPSLLLALDEPSLIRMYLLAMGRDVTLEPAGAEAVRAVTGRGWTTYRPDLLALFKATNAETIERNARLLSSLALAALRLAGKGGESESRQICRALAEVVLSALERLDAPSPHQDWRTRRPDRAQVLVTLAKALLAVGLNDLLAGLVTRVLQLPKLYSLREVHVPAIADLGKWAARSLKRPSPPLAEWLAACRAQLESLTAAAPQPPADFRREANVSCKCKDCAELIRFLQDPAVGQYGFQMSEPRRKHLQISIHHDVRDLTFKIDRRPRPQVLVCTKTNASHEQRVKEYHENLKHLADIRSLEAALPH